MIKGGDLKRKQTHQKKKKRRRRRKEGDDGFPVLDLVLLKRSADLSSIGKILQTWDDWRTREGFCLIGMVKRRIACK